eukprot:Selendium_serpulae@DN6261_c2_g2_i1.p1
MGAVFSYLSRMKPYHLFDSVTCEVRLAASLLRRELPEAIARRIERADARLALPICLKDVSKGAWEQTLRLVAANHRIRRLHIASPEFGIIRASNLFIGDYPVQLLALLFAARPHLYTLNGLKIRPLLPNEGLTICDLSHWVMTDGGTSLALACTLLAQSPSVLSLDFHRTRIGRLGAIYLSCLLKSPNQSIQLLRLNATQLDDRAMKLLCEGLQENSSLRYLELKDNCFGKRGAKYLASAIKTHPTLNSVLLGGNTIGPEGVRLLQTALKSNPRLAQMQCEWGAVQ